jgi:hypothetical protein
MWWRERKSNLHRVDAAKLVTPSGRIPISFERLFQDSSIEIFDKKSTTAE